MSEVKLCCDCKWFRGGYRMTTDACKHPTNPRNIVHGYMEDVSPYFARGAAGNCGVDAVLFQPSPPAVVPERAPRPTRKWWQVF